MLRDAPARGHRRSGRRRKSYMDAGDLVPDDARGARCCVDRISQPTPRRASCSTASRARSPQAEALDAMLARHGREIDGCWCSTWPRRRSSSASRRASAPTGQRRPDDEPDVVRNRYRACTWPRRCRCATTTATAARPRAPSTARARLDDVYDRLRARSSSRDRPQVLARAGQEAAAGEVVAETLALLRDAAEPGVTTPTSTAWPSARSAGAAASRPSRATAASRARSARRRTT